MEKIYSIYDKNDNIVVSYYNKKDAMDFVDVVDKDGHIVEHDIDEIQDEEMDIYTKESILTAYKNFESLINEDPKSFIRNAKYNFERLMNEKITISGFKSARGICDNGFYFLEIKDIVKDGPDRIKDHIDGFWTTPFNVGSYYEVTKDDYKLFLKAYAKATKQIRKIKKYIKFAELIIKNKAKQNSMTL